MDTWGTGEVEHKLWERTLRGHTGGRPRGRRLGRRGGDFNLPEVYAHAQSPAPLHVWASDSPHAGLCASPICASAPSACGSHKVIAMARYISLAVARAARACCRWLVVA